MLGKRSGGGSFGDTVMQDALDVSFDFPTTATTTTEQQTSLPRSASADNRRSHQQHYERAVPAFGGNAQATLQNAVDFVNHELAAHGFPSPLTFVRAGEQQASDIVNVMFALLQQKQRDVAAREDMEARYHRLETDYENSLATVTRLKQQLELSEREKRSALSKQRQVEVAVKEVTDKHKFTADELKAVKSSLLQVRTQCQHDLRRKDHELSRIKEKMSKVANDRMREHTIQFQIANLVALPSALRAAKSATTAGRDDDFMQTVLQALEERQRDTASENESLRASLFDVWNELEHMKSAVDHSLDVHQQDDDMLSPILPATFQLPYDLVRDNITERVRITLQQLRDLWDTSLQHGDRDSELARKDSTIEQQKHKILQQDSKIAQLAGQIGSLNVDMDKHTELLETWFTAANAMQTAPDSNNSSWISESPARSVQLQHAQQRQQDLERERAKVTEAAVRIGRERSKLEREKALFDAARLAAEIKEQHDQEQDSVDALLRMLPPTPQQQRTAASTAPEFKMPAAKNWHPTSSAAVPRTRRESDSAVFGPNDTTEDVDQRLADGKATSFFGNISRIAGNQARATANNLSADSAGNFVAEYNTFATPSAATAVTPSHLQTTPGAAGNQRRPNDYLSMLTPTTQTPTQVTGGRSATDVRPGKEQEDLDLASYFDDKAHAASGATATATTTTAADRLLSPTSTTLASPPTLDTPNAAHRALRSEFNTPLRDPQSQSHSQQSALVNTLLKSALKNSSKTK
ncbi:hypothetical protein RI367_008122, partial [Sorochytrium milnesiophthora]